MSFTVLSIMYHTLDLIDQFSELELYSFFGPMRGSMMLQIFHIN